MMQTVPSLVGTGTAVAAAATGLVFGEPTDAHKTTTSSPSTSTPVRPSTHRRKPLPDREPAPFARFDAIARLSRPRPASSAGPLAVSIPQGGLDDRHYDTLPHQFSLPTTSPIAEATTTTPSDPAFYPSASSAAVPLGAAARHLRPVTTQATPPNPKGHFRRHSLVRLGDGGAPSTIAEDARDSVSSNGSWMRRFSIRPLSQHGSIRSSIGPDSPSLTFSHGSAAPILPSAGLAAAPSLPPNKLVKRDTAGYAPGGAVNRRRSKTHLPTLRRPATSHQRSATQQQQHHLSNNGLPSPTVVSPKISLDHQLARDLLGPSLLPPTQPSPHDDYPHRAYNSPIDQTLGSYPPPREPSISWSSFFHSLVVKVGNRTAHGKMTDSSPHSSRLTPAPTRIVLDGSAAPRAAYLIRPRALAPGSSTTPDRWQPEEPVDASDTSPAADADPHGSTTPDDTPSRRARRSISMTFSAPGNWISRAGSIRRPKRGAATTVATTTNSPSATGKQGGKRHVSAPISTPRVQQNPTDMTRPLSSAHGDSDIFHNQRPAMSSSHDATSSAAGPRRTHKRNTSSPLPPLSRLSSFNVDLSRLGSGVANGPTTQPRPHQASGSTTGSSGSMLHMKSPRTERSSTLNSSDLDTRDFVSGDDDDTDFRSDTMFDSIRTVASARVRTVETPIESMFDESPPSTSSNTTKAKRLSIQEILGRAWDDDSRILEEDEGLATPVHDAHPTNPLADLEGHGSDEESFTFRPATTTYTLPADDFARLSLDDDFDLDEDWTKDDEGNELSNHLSPPSQGSSLNSQGLSPNLRLALASISGNGSQDPAHEARSERPLSNLFEWSESTILDKVDTNGQSHRPRTVHGRQEMDVRGGRSATRKGPSAAHVRSQSVPVVHDPADTTKPTTTKFGTWGMAGKTVSEDWGDDFEFEEPGPTESSGSEEAKPFVMVVPASIQATQPSVKAHSGQIRELSLLVNDLKRLCRHGKNMNMLNGPYNMLWKEAEGIITLASPDEDGMDEDEAEVSRGEKAAAASVNGQFDDGFDVASLARSDDFFDMPEKSMSKTAVVRERPSPRRRSVFLPDDDIFGGGGSSWPLSDDKTSSRPRTPENKILRGSQDSHGLVRSVMEAMQQQRSISDPVPGPDGKLHFGTANLKALVKKASDLRDALSSLVRMADPIASSPARTPRHDPSPAFTRVFDDPSSSPVRRLPHSASNNSILGRASMDASPSNGVTQRRIPLMTVS